MGNVRKLLGLSVVFLYAATPLVYNNLTYELTIILALGMAGLAVSILLRSGLISFGHAMFYALGAYAVAFGSKIVGNDVLASILFALLISLVASMLVGAFVVRYRGIFFAMLNLALSMVMYTALLKFYTVSGGSDGVNVNAGRVLGMTLGATEFGLVLFFVTLICAGVSALAVHKYLTKPFGWALLAIQDCELRVEYLGASARVVLFVAYVISGVLVGLSGAITAVGVGHVAPDTAYWTMSAAFLVIAVLGGSGNVVGPFMGAVVYEILSVSLAQWMSSSWELVLGIIIFLVVRFAPEGLWGIYDNLWKLIRRYLKKHSIKSGESDDDPLRALVRSESRS